MNSKFVDNTPEVLDALENAIERGLEAIGMAAEGHAKREITKKVYTRGVNDKHKYRLTGRLRNSITYAISGKSAAISDYKDNDNNKYLYEGTAPNDSKLAVYIGSNVEYAPYVELGTSKMRPRAFLRPAATEHAEEYKQLMRESLENA